MTCYILFTSPFYVAPLMRSTDQARYPFKTHVQIAISFQVYCTSCLLPWTRMKGDSIKGDVLMITLVQDF